MSKISVDDLSKLVGDEVMLLDERITRLEKRVLLLEVHVLGVLGAIESGRGFCQKSSISDLPRPDSKMKIGYIRN